MNDFTFNTVKMIINQRGGAAQLGSLIKDLGYSRVLLIADPGILEAGHASRLAQSITALGLHCFTFHDVGPDPTEAMVIAATAFAQKNHVECIIGIGGGSVMDVAKASAALCKPGTRLEEIYGLQQVKNGRLPLILVPTTAGTGSEVTASTVISHETGKKNVAIDPVLCADIALLDVELLNTMPRRIATTTGVDAIVHAIEAYTSVTKKNPISDMLACEALRLLMGNLIPSLQDQAPIEYRANVLLGSMLAGQAFSNSSVSAVHAFAYALAEKYHLPHGLSNSLVLIPLLKFNVVTAAAVYGKLGKAVFPEILDRTDAQAADYFIGQLENLLRQADLDKQLREFGVTQQAIPVLAEISSGMERLLNNNPRKIDYAAAEQIFSEAY